MAEENQKDITTPTTEEKKDVARPESRGQRTESRPESRESRPESREQRTESRPESREPRSESRPESREQRTESRGPREPRSESRDSRPRNAQGSRRSDYRGHGRYGSRYRDRIDFRSLKIDYKKPDILKNFTTEQGKILPRRITGIPAKMQRKVVREIKRARVLALLPFKDK